MKNFISILIVSVLLAITISCATYPAMAKTDPQIFENDYIKIEFAIGIKVYNFSVFNKTDNEISITNKSSIISIGGQSKNLFDSTDDMYIPPRSWILFTTNQDVFFNQNMYTRFVERNTSATSHNSRQRASVLTDVNIIKNNAGNIIRIYLSFFINEKEEIYDIPLKIIGVMDKDEIRKLF